MMPTVVHIPGDFGPAVADRLVSWAVRRPGELSIAVSGGRTPRCVLGALTSPELSTAMDWARIRLFQVDERSVPPDHPESNWGLLAVALLSHLDPPPRAYRMETELGPEDAAQSYAARLRAELGPAPRLDLVLLGLGDDGHTASLFPQTRALYETECLVAANFVPSMATTRITLTYPALIAARERWFLVTGADKADSAERVLMHRDPGLPATRVADLSNTMWLVDDALFQALTDRGLALPEGDNT